MAHEVKMPSGATVLNLWSAKTEAAPAAVASDDMESTSASMMLDVDGQCPKCQSQMGIATAADEQVYYCDNCRVSLPLPAND
jgi:formamidopyrimidine-DNA glycosylase